MGQAFYLFNLTIGDVFEPFAKIPKNKEEIEN
jgi:hypothetical protein